MDTLKNYLEGMFAGLGNSPEVLKAKEELLSMMEDKYNELRQQGLNDNTAIGQVITEFGNLEELAEVLGIQQQVSSQDELLTIEPHTVDTMVSDYLKYYPKFGYALVLLMVGVSIFLSFVAISQAPSFTLLNENEMIATALLILLSIVAIAVYILIITFGHLQPYEHLEKEPFKLESMTQKTLENQVKQKAQERQTQIALSVFLFILSAIPVILSGLITSNIPLYVSSILLVIFIVLLKQIKLLLIYIPLLIVHCYLIYLYGPSPIFGVSTTILIASVGVYNLVSGNALTQVTNILLQKEEYSIKQKTDKLSETISGIYWLIATAIYLGWSFLTNNWHITWLVWPIAGILYSGIQMIINYQNQKKAE